MDDRAALIERLAEIAAAIDGRDWEAISRAFTPDAHGYGRDGGPDAIVAQMRAHLDEGLTGVGHHSVPEHVRVPARHFRAEALDDVLHREFTRLCTQLTVEHDLEQQVAELLHEVVARAFIDRFQHLVGLLDEVGLQGGPRLLAIPRATPLASEAGHE